MNNKWVTCIMASLLVMSLVSPVLAEDVRTIEDESVYDLLVDRFFNKNVQNDYEVNTQKPYAFSGGDFAGVVEKLSHIEKMGFTMLSIGPVFATDTYDGRTVLDYSSLERHFGSEEDLKTLIEEAHERDIRIMIDVPTQSLSSEHLWVSQHPDWFSENMDGTFALDTSNREVQKELTAILKTFIGRYDINGLRLLDSDMLDESFIRSFSEAIKEVRPLYIIGDSEMAKIEGIDAVVLPGAERVLREAYKTMNTDTDALVELMNESEGTLIRIDSLDSSRFTQDAVEEKMFPPTRWKLALAQVLTMPGIPVIQYGSETAVIGGDAPESHPLLNLRVDEELINKIRDWSSLRNESEALRTGDLEILTADEGWLVYKRYNDEESWIIAINNTSTTRSLTIPDEVVGDNQELRGLFESDIVRENEEGEYQITLNRELAEAYTVNEDRGYYAGYLAALALMFVVFIAFLWVAWRKGKQRKLDEGINN